MAWLFKLDPVIVLDETRSLHRTIRDAAALVILRDRAVEDDE